MSEKEADSPEHRDKKVIRRDEIREEEAASSTDRASKETRIENRAEPDTSEAEKTSMPEDPTLEETATNSKETSEMPERESAEERKDPFSQSARPPRSPSEHKGAGSPGGNDRSRRKSLIWFVVLILLIILAAAGNAYYTRFLIEKEQKALTEELTAQLDTRVESLVASQVNRRLSDLSESKDSLRQAIADLERTVEGYASNIANLEKTVEERANSIASLEKTIGKHADSIASLEGAVGEHTDRIQAITSLEKAADRQINSIKTIQQDMDALESALQNLRTEVEKGPEMGAWSIAEAAYLMRIASERLHLGRDVNTAIIALQRADDIFQRMGNPVFAPVRSKLAGEINALKAVSVPDIDDMALTLTHLIEQVSELELKRPPSEEPAIAAKTEEEAGQAANQEEDSLTAKAGEFLHVIWNDLEQLFTVQLHRGEKKGVPVLPPENRYFLYQNLRMELEGARLSLLHNNQEGFQQSLHLAQKWLQTYFQGATAEAMKDTLAKLAQTPISPALPDISGSLETLHQVLERRGAQAARDNKGDNT